MISHWHKTIFVHIPKCGGQSVERAFLRDLNLSWATRAPLLLRPNDRPEIGPPRLAHLNAKDYVRCHYISNEIFEAYYKFSIVRNPFDRVVSTINYLLAIEEARRTSLTFFAKRATRRAKNFKDAFDKFIYAPATENSSPSSTLQDYGLWFVQPQVNFLLDSDGSLLVDDIYKLENLKTTAHIIRQRSNLVSDIGKVNKSRKTYHLQDIDFRTEAAIRDIYQQDFEFLSY